MAQVKVTWSAAPGKVLSGDYTLSRGITPSVISLTCIPFTEQIPAVSDVTFQDGGTALTFKDCRFASKGVSRSNGGTVWTIQLLDRRWHWKLAGTVAGHYNKIINNGFLPANLSPEKAAETKNSRVLAEILLKAMDEADYDVTAITDKDFPETQWDHVNPAEALQTLIDPYGLVICYNPVTGKVCVEVNGEGEDLPAGPLMLSDDIGTVESLKPKTLRAVCAKMQHEQEFMLEAVALDTDGTIRTLDDPALSYLPAGGDWGSDYLLFSGIPEDSIADPNDSTKTTTKRELAAECVYRWYRIIPQFINGWRRDGKEYKHDPQLDWLLPISGQLTEAYMATENKTEVLKYKQASVRGEHASDWKGMGQTNSAATVVVNEGFTLDEKLGIVKFSQPVFKWLLGYPVAATLYLRCVVTGDRYVKEKNVGGAFGVETLDCSHLTVKYRSTTYGEGGKPVNLTGEVGVDAAIDRIFALREKEYAETKSGSRSYAGLMDWETDGKCPQITWSVGPNGATTTASQSDEHNPWVPSEAQRRMTEKETRRTYADSD